MQKRDHPAISAPALSGVLPVGSSPTVRGVGSSALVEKETSPVPIEEVAGMAERSPIPIPFPAHKDPTPVVTSSGTTNMALSVVLGIRLDSNDCSVERQRRPGPGKGLQDLERSIIMNILGFLSDPTGGSGPRANCADQELRWEHAVPAGTAPGSAGVTPKGTKAGDGDDKNAYDPFPEFLWFPFTPCSSFGTKRRDDCRSTFFNKDNLDVNKRAMFEGHMHSWFPVAGSGRTHSTVSISPTLAFGSSQPIPFLTTS